MAAYHVSGMVEWSGDYIAASVLIAAIGATIIRDQVEVKDGGSFSIITDPTGVMLGLWQSRKG